MRSHALNGLQGNATGYVGRRMRTALMSSLAHTHVRTRFNPRTHTGNGAKPPANPVRCANRRSIPVRRRYNAFPNDVASSTRDRAAAVPAAAPLSS